MNVSFIDIVKKPSKTSYEVGDTFDLTGSEIYVEYDDSTREEITSLVTVTPEVLSASDKYVIIHYIGEYEGEDMEFTQTLPISVHSKAAWKFMDGAGLEYFYALLLQTFIPKSSSQDYSGEEHYNKLMAYDDAGRVSYIDTSIFDAQYLKGISEILPSDSEKTFVELINFINKTSGFVNDYDVMTKEDVQKILNDEFIEGNE